MQRLVVELLELLPRDAALIGQYAELSLPAGWPRDAGTTRVQAAARNVHERIAAAIDARPPLDPNVMRALRRLDARALAWASEADGAMSSAIAGCNRLDDDGFEVLRAFATWRTRARDAERAILALESARRCAGHRHEVAQDLGALRLSQGQVLEALRLFREALLADPDDVDRMRDLASALLTVGEIDEAITLLERACSTPSARCLLDLAGAHAESGHAALAADHARRALGLAAPTDAEPALVLGAALAAQGRNAEAREAYEEALRRAPDDPRARRSLEALERPPTP